MDRGAAVGVASGIWPHGRYRFDFTGAGEPRGHDPDGGPARPDADLRDDRAGRQQAGPGGRAQRATFGRVEVAPNGTNADPVAGDRRGWTPGASTDAALAALVDDDRRGRRTERAGARRHVAGGDRRVGVGRGRLRPRPGGGGSPPTTRAATGRCIPTAAGHDAGHPVRRRASRPRCCSCATRPASRTRPTSTPRSPTAWSASPRWPTRWRGWRGERRRRTSWSGRGSTGAVHDDVLVTIEDGRFTAVGPASSRAGVGLAGTPDGCEGCNA